VTKREMDPTIEVRLKRWIGSVGTVTLPLLAGFSITAIVFVVSEDGAKFLLPGVTILVLAFAALTLIVAVQCAYHAHVYLSEQDPNPEKGLWWARRTRWFYDAGLLALLAGLALVVAPHRATGIQACFRWAAFWLACAACLGHFVWLVLDRTRGWLHAERPGSCDAAAGRPAAKA
jgi:hypothetical protein